MNKYALGTIVGTALLGFAKNSGSNSRRISLEYIVSWISERSFKLDSLIDELYIDEVVEKVKNENPNLNINLEYRLNNKYGPNPTVIYTLSIVENIRPNSSKFINHKNMLEQASAPMLYEQNEDLWLSLWDSADSPITEDLFAVENEILNNLNVSIGTTYGVGGNIKKVIVYSDTGESYKAPESNQIKLRKR